MFSQTVLDVSMSNVTLHQIEFSNFCETNRQPTIFIGIRRIKKKKWRVKNNTLGNKSENNSFLMTTQEKKNAFK